MLDITRNLLFIHIPRTGGTSIEENLGVTSSKDNLYGIHIHNNINKALQHLDCKEIIEILGEDIYNSYYKFSVVRHPYFRLMSEFYWRPKLQQTKYPNLKDGYNFFKFLRQVKDLVDNKNYNEFIYNDHFKPQVDFLMKDNKLMIDKVINFDAIDNQYRFIRDKYGISRGLEKLHSSNYLTGKKSILTEKCKNLIYEIYSKDFEVFGFSR